MQPTGFEPETAVFGWSKIPRGGAGNFCLHHRIQNGSGATHPPIQWEQGVFSLGVELPGREADDSPPSSAKVKNVWSYISIPPIRLHGVVLS
jgi:hypothetical protein